VIISVAMAAARMMKKEQKMWKNRSYLARDIHWRMVERSINFSNKRFQIACGCYFGSMLLSCCCVSNEYKYWFL